MSQKKIYLSPARHHKPCLVPGCSEAIHAEKIAQATERCLREMGYEVLCNDPSTERPLDHVRRANEWQADLYLALHTNAGGGCRCTVYNSGSAASQALSLTLAQAIGEVYPHTVRPNPSFPAERCRETWTELTDSRMPAVYCELWFHDNETDAAWGHSHIEELALALAKGIARALGDEEETFDGLSLQEVARVTAAEARGEPYEGMLAVTQCMYDRWKDAKRRFGKDLPAVLCGFAEPYAGEVPEACLQAVREVFLEGKRVFDEACLWCLGHKAKEENFADRNKRFVFLGQVGNQFFWGDEKQEVAEEPLLSSGSRGGEVQALQTRLKDMGYALPRYGADGIFGEETETAVRMFQRVAGIAVDGIVGPITRKALGTAPDKPKYVVKKGDTLVGIARSYGTTAKHLAEINRIADPSHIVPGQVLIVA